MTTMRISSYLLLSLFFTLILACSSKENNKKNNKSGELETFAGIVEMKFGGYFQECNSAEKIKLIDRSQKGYESFERLGLPRQQPAYAKFKGYRKTDESGTDFIELHQIYDIKGRIPMECRPDEMPFGVMAAHKELFRLQINPYDDLIRYQDKLTDSYLDFPYVVPTKDGETYYYETTIRTSNTENHLKISLTPGECKKDYEPDAWFDHNLTVEIDGRSYSSCASLTL